MTETLMTETLTDTLMGPGPDAAWQAVVDRDRRFDGSFVYAVESTQIYCRPSCPSRKPRRDRVAFFVTPSAAELAGFRACRRCRPADQAGHSGAKTVALACRILEDRAGPMPLDELALAVGIAPSRLGRLFRRLTGVSPRAYGDGLRVDTLKTELRESPSVSRAVYAAGYGSGSRVYEGSAARLGMRPAEYRRGGERLSIRYATAASPLGTVVVAATDVGLCFVALGDDTSALVRRLHEEFPAASISSDDAGLSAETTAIIRMLEGREPAAELPLDVRATAFRLRVWQELQRIPRGETRTYAQLAEAVGNPAAVRAVASACAANPVAVVVPCHRVVRTDGTLGGYRWGLERKRALLAAEREIGAGGRGDD